MIALKTSRIKYLLLSMMLLSSCNDTTEDGVEVEQPIQAESIRPPDWIPPEAPESYILMPPESLEIIEAAEKITSPAPQMDVVRDTIDGIAIRTPGQISIPEDEIILRELDKVDEAWYGLSYISTNSYFGVNFDNDIFSNTDYYYTNGIQFDLSTPIFAASPFAWPMLPYKKESMNYHGLIIVQNMYTPTNPDTISVLSGDRPFAAYLYFGHFKNTLSSKKKYRQYSEVIIGLMGPGSLGGFVQSQIHNIEPIGWGNQIQNDLVFNYKALFEKGIYNAGVFDLNIFTEGQIGTLYNNLGAGARIRVGKLNPYFSMPGLAKKNSAESKDALPLQYGILGSAKLRMIIYDATLQGGFFSQNNNYLIPASDIERLVLQAGIGVYFAYKELGMTYKHYYISPEFKNAKHHQWGHVNVTYCF
ncbi:MAG: lipid A deacylase LpxR family protein [Bacteroidota bacterium]